MKPAKKKKRRGYGGYYTERGGKVYGVVHLRQPDGTYKRKTKIVENKTDAMRWAVAEREKHRLKHKFDKDWTFSQMCAWYVSEFLHPPRMENGIKVSGKKDWKRTKTKVEGFSNYFADVRCEDFSEFHLRQWQTFRRKKNPELTQTTLNRDFEVFRTIFLAAKRNRKIKDVPNFDIINRAAEKKRERVLTFEEEKKLLSFCEDVETVTFKRLGKTYTSRFRVGRGILRPIVIMALDTAMRAGEIFTLRWENIDLENRLIRIYARQTKTQKARTVPISDRLYDELQKLKERKTGEKVFTYNRPPACYVTACEKAGMPELTFHDLRHTATTRMVNAGIPAAEVMKITGHTEMSTFLRYLNPTNESIGNTARRFSEYLKKSLE